MIRNKYGYPHMAELAKSLDAMAALNAETPSILTALDAHEHRRKYLYPDLGALVRARQLAAEARARILAAPCQCADCVKASNLPAVQRVLAHWTPLDKGI